MPPSPDRTAPRTTGLRDGDAAARDGRGSGRGATAIDMDISLRTHTLNRVAIVAIFLLALAVRLVFVRLQPYDSGDWVLYRNVADAITRGCGVAVSIPGVGACVPHFGGNQLPLFPAFAAAVWTVSGHSDTAIRIVQSVLAAAAVAYLAHAVGRATMRRTAMLAAGGLLAISPVQAFWAGSLLTETLALAATCWVAAELLLSLADARLRVVPLGIALAVAVWARMDAIVLLVPAGIAASFVYGRRDLRIAATRMALVVGIVAAPCLLWSVRNVAVGLPALPRPDVLITGRYAAPGYVAWAQSWVVGQDERADARYYDIRDLKHFRLSDRAYADPAERATVTALIAKVRETPGPGVPPAIDAAFARLAAERTARMTIADRVSLALDRGWALSARWLWPWAGDVGDGRSGASATDWYRFAIVVLALAGAVVAGFRRDRIGVQVAVLAFGYFAARTAFFVLSASIELRYLVECAPLIEAAAGIGLATLLHVALPGRFSAPARPPSPVRGRAVR